MAAGCLTPPGSSVGSFLTVTNGRAQAGACIWGSIVSLFQVLWVSMLAVDVVRWKRVRSHHNRMKESERKQSVSIMHSLIQRSEAVKSVSSKVCKSVKVPS